MLTAADDDMSATHWFGAGKSDERRAVHNETETDERLTVRGITALVMPCPSLPGELRQIRRHSLAARTKYMMKMMIWTIEIVGIW